MERAAKRTKLLSDDESSEDEEPVKTATAARKNGFIVNEEFATRFEHNKKREEQHRLEEKYGKDIGQMRGRRDERDVESGDSSTDESEDSDADLATQDVDAEILDTINAIRKKDPRLYDQNVKFYREYEPEAELEGANGGAKIKTERPMYLQDYHRQNLLAGHTGDDDEEEEGDDGKRLGRSYQQEQDAVKRQLVGSLHATNGHAEDDGDFPSLGVAPWLTTSLSHLSIRTPTRIQTACIPPILASRSCIGGSRTGSGKTIAFAVPILQLWAADPSAVFAVILTPTRELALQIHEQITALGGRQGLRCALVVGGADMRLQSLELERRPHVIVATPGRLADHVMSSGEETIRGLRRVKFVVLDEADRLLSSGKGSMLTDLSTCLSVFPPPTQRQTCLFTATLTPEVRALQSMPRAPTQAPLFICEVDTEDLAVPKTLRQTYQLVNVVHKEKYLHILLLTPANAEKDTIIFCNRTSTATLIEYLLRLLSHRVTSLHSGLNHADRTTNLARFRARAARILVATDVAARGLDIPDVGLVINYDLPRDPDTYIHRVGRTARAGRKGTSISLVGQRDVELVQAIEERVGSQMAEYEEEKVSVEGRVVREAMGVVGEKKREALLNLEEGRDVRGKRRRVKSKRSAG